MRVLVLNPGSSSLKSSVVEVASDRDPAAPSSIPAAPPASAAPAPAAPPAPERRAASPTPAPALTAPPAPEPRAELDVDWGVDATVDGDPADDIHRLLARYEAIGIPAASLGAVGYRVVHGGTAFREPVMVTPAVIKELDAIRSLAPLHNGLAVAAMRACLAAIPHLHHVAVFDTAFHATLPDDGYRYPVPTRWYEEWGVRRYGFHGMSVAWSAERAAVILGSPAAELRLVVAHMGSGCSVTAVDGGRSVATSMGMTPMEGLMMGTRSGSIDPGIVFYLIQNGRLTADELNDQLEHHSGLLGVSGRTSDVRELLEHETDGDAAAALALRIFVRRAAECIAAAATSLPSLDAVVFTGGIGENAAGLRARIVARLASIGVAPLPPPDAAARGDAAIGVPGVTPAVLRIEAREDLVVARDVVRLVGSAAPR